jgi:hypothetical protein
MIEYSVEIMNNFSFTLWPTSGFRRAKSSLILKMILLASMIWLTSCDSSHGDDRANERNKMEATKLSSVQPVLRPAVDLNVPAKVETATFALG